MDNRSCTGEELNRELGGPWSVEEQKQVTRLIYELSSKTGRSLYAISDEIKKVASSFKNLGKSFEELEKALRISIGPKRNPFEERNKHTQARALRAKAKQKKRLAKKRK